MQFLPENTVIYCSNASLVKEKLFLRSELKKQFTSLQKELVPNIETHIPEFLFSEHHQSHAAAAFYPSPFEEAVVLCMDGVGEWATTSTWIGKSNKIKPLWEISFPHSLTSIFSIHLLLWVQS